MGEWTYKFIFILTSTVVGDLSASGLHLFAPREKAPGTHWIEGWVHTRIGMDYVEKK
jgi:hypothetical protein